MDKERFDEDPGFDEDTGVREKEEVKKPRLYRVILHNDDYTTMDFVVQVLMKFFHKNESEAVHVMMNVHKKGAGVAGIYTRESAETKVHQVTHFAKEHEHPLKCTMETE